VLSVTNVRKEYGQTTALADITFEIRQNEFVSIVGPSGCGKTTLLKIMAGLMRPTSGSVVLEGTPVTGPPAGMALVFQDYSRSLYPWMKVGENIAFPLESKRIPKAERAESVRAALEAVDLSGSEDLYPWQLSGGMQQRVSIARGLAYQPQILLMDEPFGALDAQTRQELEDTLLSIRERYGITIVFVTHDIDESVYLGDRVIVLTGRPTEVDEDLAVALPHPRDQIDTKVLPEFVRLRADIYSRIKSFKHAALRGADTHGRKI
jgi:NitT/TauT family transport system ATP-binding protein